jgi:hypothetical protein
VAAASTGCGGADAEAPVTTTLAPDSPSAAARPYPESPADWGSFHSRRFRLTVPLPTAKEWQIDDHSRPELVATYAATRSTLLVRLVDEPMLVNHDMCDARAKELGFAPAGATKVVEDTVTSGPEGFDTRVRVVESGQGKLVGHVTAFGASVKTCLLVHLATEAASEDDEEVLSQRLAVARVRLVGGVRIDPVGDVPRVQETPP